MGTGTCPTIFNHGWGDLRERKHVPLLNGDAFRVAWALGNEVIHL
jgi:hypothetical protein